MAQWGRMLAHKCEHLSPNSHVKPQMQLCTALEAGEQRQEDTGLPGCKLSPRFCKRTSIKGVRWMTEQDTRGPISLVVCTFTYM